MQHRAEEDEESEEVPSDLDVMEFVWDVLLGLPEVIRADEMPPMYQETFVLWARDPDAATERVRALVRQVEIEACRTEE